MKLIVTIVYFLAYWLAGGLGILIGVHQNDIVIKRKDKDFIQIKRSKVAYTLVLCIAIAFSLSFVRENYASKESQSQLDTTRKFFKAINDGNENRLNRTLILMQKENNSQQQISQQKNDYNRNITIDSVIKTLTQGEKKSDKNVSDIKRQIRDSISKVSPADLEIVSSFDTKYYHPQRLLAPNKYSIIVGLRNYGGLSATDVKFTYETIFSLKPEYIIKEKYMPDTVKNVYNEVEQSFASMSDLYNIIDLNTNNKFINFDTVFFVLGVHYKSQFRNGNIDYKKLYCYISEKDIFSEYVYEKSERLTSLFHNFNYGKPKRQARKEGSKASKRKGED